MRCINVRYLLTHLLTKVSSVVSLNASQVTVHVNSSCYYVNLTQLTGRRRARFSALSQDNSADLSGVFRPNWHKNPITVTTSNFLPHFNAILKPLYLPLSMTFWPAFRFNIIHFIIHTSFHPIIIILQLNQWLRFIHNFYQYVHVIARLINWNLDTTVNVSKERQQLTLRWCEEVEERVVLHSLHNSSFSSTSFVLLNFLYDFYRYVLALLPVDCAPATTVNMQNVNKRYSVERSVKNGK